MDAAQPPVMQRENERSRFTVDGKSIDDGERCALLVVQETAGTWALYPHGWGKFGVRVAEAEAVTVARAILGGAQ